MITVRDAVRRTGRNAETIRRWIWDGKLPARKIGNQLFIEESDLAPFTDTARARRVEEQIALVHELRQLHQEIRAQVREPAIDVATLIEGMRVERSAELLDDQRDREG